jgi:hypothetical protein
MEGSAMTTRVLGPSADPELSDVIHKIKSDVGYALNCVQIGTIESFNKLTNTASVSINFKRQLPDGSTLDYPLLCDCPVFILSGGGTSIEMPITSGDTCLILFNDRNIDNWFYSGQVTTPANPRAHDISDGICLVGVRALTKAAPMSDKAIRLMGYSKKIAINNTLGGSLKLLIDSLIDTISDLVTIGSAATQALDPATKALLATLKTNFALLLDEGTP